MRLKDKIAIIFGAGQAPGETPAIGNGRAVSLLFAREGAKILAVDCRLDSAEETVSLIRGEGGEAEAATGNDNRRHVGNHLASTSPAYRCRHCPLRGGQPVSIRVDASNYGSTSAYRGEKRAVSSDQL